MGNLNCLEAHLTEEQIDAYALGQLHESAATHFMMCDQCVEELERTIDLIDCLRAAHTRNPQRHSDAS
jgi:anti-sigma factor ChrR (cupin superfamily)